MVRCRVESDRWPLVGDVNNPFTALNPDVPDFQPGKIWQKGEQSLESSTKETPDDELTWNQVSTKRKKPTKKKVQLIEESFLNIAVRL